MVSFCLHDVLKKTLLWSFISVDTSVHMFLQFLPSARNAMKFGTHISPLYVM